MAQHRDWISRITLRGARALAVVLGLGLVAIPSAQAQTFTDLYNFTGSPDGANPIGAVVRDAAGNLYGTTNDRGSSNAGTVFKVDTSGTETVLHSFAGGAKDGANPFAGLLRDNAGNFYGTAEDGGSSFYGVVFKIDTAGTETVLYSFAGGTADGCYPSQGLVSDKYGDLYGTTFQCGAANYGTVFKLSKGGKETVLHSFAGDAKDGGYPSGGTLRTDKNGTLYGTAEVGGSANYGVVYGLSKKGTLTVLHSFAGGTTDGCSPFGTPTLDKASSLYGTTEACGSYSFGTVWKVSKKGTETVLHNFAGGASDGGSAIAGVVRDSKGNLYGDTRYGGAYDYGTVYQLSKGGTLTLLHTFSYTDGAYPYDDLLRDAKGNLYGTTYQGGSYGYGTVWKLTP